MNFFEKYLLLAEKNNSRLCVGIDPDPSRIPPGVTMREFLLSVVESTSDLVCSYKPNIAFFEREGTEGIALLNKLITIIPREIPVVLDAKRGDIGHTGEAYATAIFDRMNADAVTVNPYLGKDSVSPFFNRPEKGVFVLCKTSNPGSSDFQDLLVGESNQPLFLHVARQAQGWNINGNIGLVVGATYPEEAALLRSEGVELPFLIPGVGAQSGDLEAVISSSSDRNGGGFIINSSRGILYAWEEGKAGDPGCAPGGWQDSIRQAAEQTRSDIMATLDR